LQTSFNLFSPKEIQMKIYRWINTILFLVAYISNATACDVCGCGINGFQGGILPRFNQPIVGFNYTYSSFKHHDISESTFGDHKILYDRAHRFNIMARYMPNERLQLLLDIPMVMQSRVDDGGQSTLYGLGDIGAQVHYKLTDHHKQLGEIWQHAYFLGLGTRMPNGKYQQRDRFGQILPLGFQAGTGGWSHSVFSNWIVNYKKWGLHVESTVSIHLENEFRYKRGSNWLQGVYLFRTIQTSTTFIVPTFGFQVEQFDTDSEYGISINHTGGTFLNGLIRLDWQSKLFNIGVFGSINIWQKAPPSQPIRNPSLGITSIYFFE
jgi:hypothetical protein